MRAWPLYTSSSARCALHCHRVLGPARAQQKGSIVDPQASVVNEQTLLREFPRIQGDIDQPDPRARSSFSPPDGCGIIFTK